MYLMRKELIIMKTTLMLQWLKLQIIYFRLYVTMLFKWGIQLPLSVYQNYSRYTWTTLAMIPKDTSVRLSLKCRDIIETSTARHVLEMNRLKMSSLELEVNSSIQNFQRIIGGSYLVLARGQNKQMTLDMLIAEQKRIESNLQKRREEFLRSMDPDFLRSLQQAPVLPYKNGMMSQPLSQTPMTDNYISSVSLPITSSSTSTLKDLTARSVYKETSRLLQSSHQHMPR